MMFIPNKPEIWQALREKGLEEDARGLTRMTGFGLWMFWVYFAYLALFGIIALVWPSYPGIALTSWIAATLPYGVFALTRADLLVIDSPLSHGVVMHIVVWQAITIAWLWGATILNFRRMERALSGYLGMNRDKPEVKAKQTKAGIWTIITIFILFTAGLSALTLCYFVFPGPVLEMLDFGRMAAGHLNALGFLIFLFLPCFGWLLLIFFIAIDGQLIIVLKKRRAQNWRT